MSKFGIFVAVVLLAMIAAGGYSGYKKQQEKDLCENNGGVWLHRDAVCFPSFIPGVPTPN